MGENEDSYVQSYIQTQSTGIACETLLTLQLLERRENERQRNTPLTRGVGVNASRLLWMDWRQALLNWIVGPSRRFTGVASGRSWKRFNFSSAMQASANQIALCKYPIVQTLANPVHATPEK